MLGGTPGYQAEAAEIVDQALELLAQELVVGSQDFPEHLGEVCRLVVRGSPVEAYWRDDLDTMQKILLARAGDLEVEGQGCEEQWGKCVGDLVEQWWSQTECGQKIGPSGDPAVTSTGEVCGQTTGPTNGELDHAQECGQQTGPPAKEPVPVHEPSQVGCYRIQFVEKGYPAELSGLRPNEKILAVNEIRMPRMLNYFLSFAYRHRHEGQPLQLWVENVEGQRRRVDVAVQERQKGRVASGYLGCRVEWVPGSGGQRRKTSVEKASSAHKDHEQEEWSKSKKRRKRRQGRGKALQEYGQWSW